MSIENPKKPQMKIVHMKDGYKLENPKSSEGEKEILKINPNNLDLEFCEDIEEILKIDEHSRSFILKMLYGLLEDNPVLEMGNRPSLKSLKYLLRVYNQIYRFEADKNKKELARENINQTEFAIR